MATTIKKVAKPKVEEAVEAAELDIEEAEQELEGEESDEYEVVQEEPVVVKNKVKKVQKVESHQAVGTTHTQHKDGSAEETQEVLGEAKFTGPVAMVQVSMSMTKNLGNYESLKFTASITMPCEADGEEIEETYNNCREWVDSKVNAFNEEVSEQLG